MSVPLFVLACFACVAMALFGAPAAEPAPSLRQRFLAFDDALARLGVPPLTSWWRAEIGRWLDAYEAGGCLELLVCAGRGSAKSTALYKLALFFTLFVAFVIPPGERHYAVILSRLKEEAGKGVDIISAWLTLLGVAHRVAGDVIEFVDLPRGIRVVAASVAGCTGWRAIFVGKDERSKWPQGGVVDEDAEEIDTSAAAMTATHARAPIVAFGSAWGAAGAFYEAIMGGDDAGRIVCGPAATWVAAPHIAEASCRAKERDARRFAREYECRFSAGSGNAFSADEVAHLPRVLSETAQPVGTAMAFLDSSAGKADAWTWWIAQHVLDAVGEELVMEERVTTDSRGTPSVYRYPSHDTEGRQVRNPDYVVRQRLHIDSQGALTGKFGETIPFPVAVARVARVMLEAGVRKVASDQFQSYPLTSEFRKYGIELVELPWTAPAKVEATAMLRTMLADQTIGAEPGDETNELRADLLELDEVLTKSGAITVQARRTRRGHGDRGALAMLTARAESEGLISGSPIGKKTSGTTLAPHEGSQTGL